MHTLFIVQTSFGKHTEARSFARRVVEEGLVACAQVLEGVHSCYIWQREVVEENECIVTMKVLRANYEQLEFFIEKNHPYDTPEIIAIEAAAVSRGYMDWVLG